MIKLELKPITDNDPVVLKFKNICLEEMKEARYVSWIQPLVMSRTYVGGIRCVAPTAWFAEYLSTNDIFNIGSFLHKINIPEVIVAKPNGTLAGKILPTPPRESKGNHSVFDRAA